jgi:PTS system cellobiose-specific IIA component
MSLHGDPKTVEIVTQVILQAGNARTFVAQALKSASEDNFTIADKLIKEAEKEVREAHRTQTKMVQSEARGEEVELSILLIHAQDTLMIAISEINMAKQLVKMYQKISDNG